MASKSDQAQKANDAAASAPSSGPESPESVATAVLDVAERSKRGDRIVQDHVLMSVAAGIVPGPAVDIALGFGIQLTMLARLAKLYEVPFRRELAKKLVVSLFGSLGGVGAGAIAAGSIMKIVPGIGTALGVLGVSVSMGAFTYAVGKVFQQHFESGGTFIDLDPRAYRDYFREMFRRGKDVAKQKKEEAQTVAATETEVEKGRAARAELGA